MPPQESWIAVYVTHSDQKSQNNISTCNMAAHGFPYMNKKTGIAEICGSKWGNFQGSATAAIIKHAAKHGLTEVIHHARINPNRNAAPGQPAIDVAMENATASASDFAAIASQSQRELYFISGLPFSIVGSVGYRGLFHHHNFALKGTPQATLPAIKNRGDVPLLMLQLCVDVRHHHLSRFSSITNAETHHQQQERQRLHLAKAERITFAAIACDGGTKLHHFACFVLLVAGFTPIFLSLVDVDRLAGGLNRENVYRIVNFYAEHLWTTYKIKVIAFIADNASYMHATQEQLSGLVLPPHIVVQLEGDTLVDPEKIDVFLPTQLDGRRASVLSSIDNNRCTAHSYQLVSEDICQQIPVLQEAMIIGNRVFDKVKEVLAEKDSAHQHPGLTPINKGSASRWWSVYFTFLSECAARAKLLKMDQIDIVGRIDMAVGFLKTYKDIGDMIEGYRSSMFDALFVFSFIDETAHQNTPTGAIIKKIWLEDRIHPTNGAVTQARAKFWISKLKIIIAYFHSSIWLAKSAELVTVGADKITEILRQMFGEEVADEHEEWRLTLAAVPGCYRHAATRKICEKDYLRDFQNAFLKRFPKLTEVVVGVTLVAHTEVECERKFSVAAALFPPNRGSLTPTSCHAAMGVHSNWSIDVLKPQPHQLHTTFQISGTSALRYLEFALLPMCTAALQQEQASNPMLRYNSPREMGKARPRYEANRTEAQRKFLQEEHEAKRRDVAHRQLLEVDLVCGVCTHPFLHHIDNFGETKCWDWFIECSICKKLIHSDCSGITPDLRSRAERESVWACNGCVVSDDAPAIQRRAAIRAERLAARARRNNQDAAQ